jgi:hypothetical protein
MLVHDWLDQYIINSIEEAQHFATQWLWTYNNDRPNMGIGGITPAMKLKRLRKFYDLVPLKAGGLPNPVRSTVQMGQLVA